ncbi:hypothetical protein B4Q13_16670, partial [Lacticaseibacillus rhamnosus]
MHFERKPKGDGGLTRLVRACAEHPLRTLGLWAAAIVVIVASSVTAPFEQFIKIYEKKHPGTTVSAKYLGGQVIQADVEGDTPTDVVIVGKNQTDKLTAHINPPVAILTNREVILVPKGSTKVKSLK